MILEISSGKSFFRFQMSDYWLYKILAFISHKKAFSQDLSMKHIFNKI